MTFNENDAGRENRFDELTLRIFLSSISLLLAVLAAVGPAVV
jgi:hypothetical protein